MKKLNQKNVLPITISYTISKQDSIYALEVVSDLVYKNAAYFLVGVFVLLFILSFPLGNWLDSLFNLLILLCLSIPRGFAEIMLFIRQIITRNRQNSRTVTISNRSIKVKSNALSTIINVATPLSYHSDHHGLAISDGRQLIGYFPKRVFTDGQWSTLESVIASQLTPINLKSRRHILLCIIGFAITGMLFIALAFAN